MRITTLLLISLLILANQLIGQNWLEIIEKEKSSITSVELKKLDRLVSEGVYDDYWLVNVPSLESYIIDDKLRINIPDRAYAETYRKTWVGGSGSGQSVWEGMDNSETGYAIFIIDGGTIFGHFYTEGEDYMLYNMPESRASVVVKQNKYHNQDKTCGNEVVDRAIDNELGIADADNTDNRRLMAIQNCEVRTLVYYTQEADDDNPNIVETTKCAIAETNQAFRNSGVTANDATIVTASIEKLAILPANWTGSSITQDIGYLRADSIVLDRRNTLGADIVVCLVPNDYGNFLGYSASDTLDDPNAFSLVNEETALGNIYTFGHELGHLFGCHHHDGDHAYARGYSFIKGFTTYRTIMKIGTFNFNRIQHFSNPDITFLGKATGKSTRNNARRLRETGCILANHRTTNNPTLTASIQGPSNGYPLDYALFQSDVDGGAPGAYSYEWRTSTSGTPIGPTLSSSFNFATTIPNNPYSNLYVHLKVTSADGQIKNSVHTLYIESSGWGFRMLADNNEPSKLVVYPVPVQDKTMVSFEASTKGKGKILVYNSFGNLVKQNDFDYQEGLVQLKYDLNELKEGLYVIKVKMEDYLLTKKIIVE